MSNPIASFGGDHDIARDVGEAGSTSSREGGSGISAGCMTGGVEGIVFP